MMLRVLVAVARYQQYSATVATTVESSGNSYNDYRERDSSSSYKSDAEIEKKQRRLGYCQGMNFVCGSLLLAGLGPCPPLMEEEQEQEQEEETDDEKEEESDNIDNSNNQKGDGRGQSQDSSDNSLVEVEGLCFAVMLSLATNGNIGQQLSVPSSTSAAATRTIIDNTTRRSKLDMGGLWAEKLPRLKLRVFQLERLLRWHSPRLATHFTRLQLSPELLTAQWFLTLFAYFLTAEDTIRLWDYLFIAGWPGLFRAAVALLLCLEPELLAAEDLEAVAGLLRTWKEAVHRNHHHSHNRNDRSSNGIKRQSMMGLVTARGILDTAKATARLAAISQPVLDKLEEAYGAEILSLAVLRCHQADRRLLRQRQQQQQQLLLQQQQQGQGQGQDGASPSNTIPSPGGSPLSPVSDNSDGREEEDEEREDMALVQQLVIPGVGRCELPTFWLRRYGHKLSLANARELFEVHKELVNLDWAIDRDKQLLQGKILNACNQQRAVEEQAKVAEERWFKAEQRMQAAQNQFAGAVQAAQLVVEQASRLLQHQLPPPPLLMGRKSSSNNHSNSFNHGNKQQTTTDSSAEPKKQSVSSGGGMAGPIVTARRRSNSKDKGTLSSSAVAVAAAAGQDATAAIKKAESNSSSSISLGGHDFGLLLMEISDDSNQLAAGPVAEMMVVTGELQRAGGDSSDDASSSSSNATSPIVIPLDSDDNNRNGHEDKPRPATITRSSSNSTSTTTTTSSSNSKKQPNHSYSNHRHGGKWTAISASASASTTRESSSSSNVSSSSTSQPTYYQQQQAKQQKSSSSSSSSSSFSWYPGKHLERALASHGIHLSVLSQHKVGGNSSSGGGRGGLSELEERGQQAQRTIILLQREMEEQRKAVDLALARLLAIRDRQEEAAQWKKALCDQLQLLVEDSNR